MGLEEGFLYMYISGMIFAEMIDTDLFLKSIEILFLYFVQKSKTMSLLYCGAQS